MRQEELLIYIKNTNLWLMSVKKCKNICANYRRRDWLFGEANEITFYFYVTTTGKFVVAPVTVNNIL